MSYATIDQLTDRYGERMLIALTDRAATPTGAVVVDVVTRALTDTDAMIDGYLAGRYALPLDETPDLIVDLAQVIAIYKLHRSSADPKIEQDYKDAIASLRDISTGKIRLNVAGVEPDGTGQSGARTTDRERPFTNDNMKGFI